MSAEEQLPGEKHNQVVKAAIREFAAKGYERASTNAITREAGISKGLLFHYFGSKKQIFLYALDRCVEHLLAEYTNKQAGLSPDIFERIIQVGSLKIQMFHDAPDMYRMATEAFVNTPAALKEEIATRQQALAKESLGSFFAGLDTSRFRPDVDPMKAIQLVYTYSEALSSQYIARIRETGQDPIEIMPAALLEMREGMRMIMYGVYRQDA